MLALILEFVCIHVLFSARATNFNGQMEKCGRQKWVLLFSSDLTQCIWRIWHSKLFATSGHKQREKCTKTVTFVSIWKWVLVCSKYASLCLRIARGISSVFGFEYTVHLWTFLVQIAFLNYKLFKCVQFCAMFTDR